MMVVLWEETQLSLLTVGRSRRKFYGSVGVEL
jgi:hypothetical protein